MRAAIVVFPGSNRERDTARALTHVGAPDAVFVWHRETSLPDCDLVVLPGGFAHGDYLRAGAIAARSHIMEAVAAHASRGGLVLGICNGFQVLTEARLLPGALMRNEGLNFVCRAQELSVERPGRFTDRFGRGATPVFPIAHHDGNFRADTETVKRLEGEGRVAFRYRGNPNGSANDIAGITNEAGNVLGMMPHPENAVEAFHTSQDGRALFESLRDAAGR